MGDGRDRVADLGLADVLQAGRDVADLARHEPVDRHELRAEDAQLQRLRLGAAGHQADGLARLERALGEPDVDDHALVGVVVAVEDEALDGLRGIALGRWDAGDDGLEDLGHAGPVLGAREDDLLARDRQHVLQLVHDRLGVRGRQVDLVEDRDEGEALADREVDVGERLRFDALRRVDDEDRALAGLEAVAHLVGEVHVTRACRSG